MAPMQGMKIIAISSEANKVAVSVIGRYFMNSPVRPGQNAIGPKAAMMVVIDEKIGQAMRLVASA